MAKQAPVPMTREEVDLILATARKHNEFNYIFLRVLRKSGRRIGELYGLRDRKTKTWKYGVQVRDFNFSNNTFETYILKRRSYRRKLAFLDPGTMGIIARYVKKMKLGPEDYFFRAKSYRYMQKLPGIYARRAGLAKPVCCHGFRHYFITYCKAVKKMPHEDIQKLTGHTCVSVIGLYDHSDAWSIEKEARDVVRGV